MTRLFSALLGVMVLAAAGWSLWWYIGAEGQRLGFERWLEVQRDRGWQADADPVDVTGYPLDFRTVVEDLALADPRTGWSWQAPRLTAESAAISPTRVTVTWPRTQSLATLDGAADIKAARMETVLDLRPGPSMELRQANGQIETLRIDGREGWSARAGEVSLDLSEKPADLGPENSYDVKARAAKVELPQEWLDGLDPTGILTPFVDRITFRAHGAFDQPLDRVTVEEGRMALRAATIREAGFEWGEMRLVVKGSFEVDDDGFPDGEITVRATEWRRIIRLAVRSGLMGRDLADTVQGAIEVVTALTGGGEDLDLPLNLSGGSLSIGPFDIADVPRVAPPRI